MLHRKSLPGSSFLSPATSEQNVEVVLDTGEQVNLTVLNAENLMSFNSLCSNINRVSTQTFIPTVTCEDSSIQYTNKENVWPLPNELPETSTSTNATCTINTENCDNILFQSDICNKPVTNNLLEGSCSVDRNYSHMLKNSHYSFPLQADAEENTASQVANRSICPGLIPNQSIFKVAPYEDNSQIICTQSLQLNTINQIKAEPLQAIEENGPLASHCFSPDFTVDNNLMQGYVSKKEVYSAPDLTSSLPCSESFAATPDTKRSKQTTKTESQVKVLEDENTDTLQPNRALQNRHSCQKCHKLFAFNRILVRSTAFTYTQGKPRYCIGCFQEFKPTSKKRKQNLFSP